MGPRRCLPALGPALGLLLALSWLGGTRAEEMCAFPDRLQYAEPVNITVTSFPVGTMLRYICRPGFIKIPGKPSTRTCGEDLQWSPVEQFCKERKCKHPGELANGVTDVTDLTFGSKATFSCVEGFRLIGSREITCVIQNKGVDWDGSLPFCEIIPCAPPPSIANGSYTQADSYTYQTAVTYTCDKVPKDADPFSLIGSATIFCTTDEHSNGIWSEPPPRCKVVKCDNPKVENGRRKGFGLSYTYMDSVMFECDPGYSMIGPETITCGENNTWSQKPTCEKSGPPSSSLPPSSGFTPEINYGRVIEGQKPSYSVGDFITIECYAGYTLHGEARIKYVGENQWAPGVPTCQLSAYIVAIICVTVAIVVFLAAIWVYKAFFSRNGSYTVDESYKEICILETNVPADMEETPQMN